MAITDTIDDNLSLATARETVDQLNSVFYSQFPYPWRPRALDSAADPDFARIVLNQNLGSWSHDMVPPNPKIWVAGCGTNQAAITALNFPTASVRGSDLSPESLKLCASTAADLGCTNLELRNESINQADYTDQFDYVICTGVIHHNAEPEATLQQLAKALKPTGVLELMVYNRYHRILTSAFQKAVRLIAGTETTPNFEKELSTTKALMDKFPATGLMQQFVAQFKGSPDVAIADALMQPVENSYTVETLADMAARCGLEYITPTPNALDRGLGNISWNMRFLQPELQQSYEKLPDSRRWQITNLLLCENSPFLWMYLRRKDGPIEKKSEQEICDSFLRTRFKPNAVGRRSYILTKENKYTKVNSPLPYPGMPAKPEMRKIVETAKNDVPMGQILESMRIGRDFFTVNDLRLRLTTSIGPFLRAVA